MLTKAGKQLVLWLVTVSVCVSMAGCQWNRKQKEPKPQPQKAVKVDEGNTDASGKGNGQSDVPFVVACGTFQQTFNPFADLSGNDRRAVDLTQVYLVQNDRGGRVIEQGIDGELREYQGESYTYYGISDLTVNYKKKKGVTVYKITLRDDLTFSDGEPLTADDVLFSMYAYCDVDYKGPYTLGKQPIVGLKDYRKGWVQEKIPQTSGQKKKQKAEKKITEVNKIRGIRKLGKYSLSVTTEGYDPSFVYALQIPVCPLHYYGERELFVLKHNVFGFERGDLSALRGVKEPLGAGAYRFVKYDKGTVYYASNDRYYKGCPQTAYLQLKESVKENGKETLPEMEIVAHSATEATVEEEPLVVAEAVEVVEGSYDLMELPLNREVLSGLAAVNGENELAGETVETRLAADTGYYYIGMNEEQVKVGENAESAASKYLRKAFAAAFYNSRGMLADTCGDAVDWINVPRAAQHWLTPELVDTVFETDASGRTLVSEENDEKEQRKRLQRAVLSYLKKAGYRVQRRKVCGAPKGASLTYTFWMAKDQREQFGAYVEQGIDILTSVGIQMTVSEIKGQGRLEKKLKSGTQQLWLGRAETTLAQELSVRYGSAGKENIFGLKNPKLDQKIVVIDKTRTAEKRCIQYEEFYKILQQQVVEIPLCQISYAQLYSAKRVRMETVAKDVTPYYGWENEIEKIRMKG